MRSVSQFLFLMSLFMGLQQMAVAQVPNAEKQEVAVSKFSRDHAHCAQLQGMSGAGVDGLSAEFSVALARVLALGGDVQDVFSKLHLACDGLGEPRVIGGVVEFYLHPTHCLHLTQTKSESKELLANLRYQSALSLAVSSLGGDKEKAIDELGRLCAVRAAGLPTGRLDLYSARLFQLLSTAF